MYRRSSWDRGYDRDAGFEKLSLDDQERVCRSFAEHNGIEIVDVVTDQSISGGAQAFLKRKILPTIERVRDGEADGVLVWELSRWGRDANTSAISEVALMEAGGRLISATEPSDTSTMRGRLLRHVQRAFNQMTMEQAQKSWRLTHDRRRTNGLPADGRGRFGYVYRRGAEGARYELDPEAAPILAGCYRRYLAGESLWSIVQDLRAKGVRQPQVLRKQPDLITYDVLQRALDSGFGAGRIVMREIHGMVLDEPRYIPGTHPPVITDQEFTDYLEMRQFRTERFQKRAADRPTRPKHALHGLVLCGACRRPMYLTAKDGELTASCRTNFQKAKSGSSAARCEFPASILVRYLVDEVREWLTMLAAESEPGGLNLEVEWHNRANRIEASIESLEKNLTQVKNYWKTTRKHLIQAEADGGDYDIAQMNDLVAAAKATVSKVTDALAEARSEMSTLREVTPRDTARAILDGWEVDLDPAFVNTSLRRLVSGIYVGNGRPDDPERVDIIAMACEREPHVTLQKNWGTKTTETEKFCPLCETWKTHDSFYARNAKRPGHKPRLVSYCIPCFRQYMNQRKRAKRATD